MRVGFVRVCDPARGDFAALVIDAAVFDLSGLVRSGICGLIRERKFNDASFLADLQGTMTDRFKCPYDFNYLWQQSPRNGTPHLRVPFDPPEVWGVGVSYKRAAELHEEDLESEGLATGLYNYVFASKRPEIFFKGLGRHCVGHNDFFTIRGDSIGTMVEAELACIYDSDGSIVGYTVANDVTAWDIEKESPLFLSYAKIFDGSCVLGPAVIPAHLIKDPLSLVVRCRVERKAKIVYEGTGSTENMKRSLAELTRYLTYCNSIPDGTALSTGTAVGIPNDLVIEDGDKVSISVGEIGELCAVARRSELPSP